MPYVTSRCEGLTSNEGQEEGDCLLSLLCNVFITLALETKAFLRAMFNSMTRVTSKISICRQRPETPKPPSLYVVNCLPRPCPEPPQCPPSKIKPPPSSVRYCVRCTCDGSTYSPLALIVTITPYTKTA
ncbi:hypothetical protein E2986_12589 [Frieseomelitta varia]|uniref:Uncharacterized protein n=1 Tax=Frieseomelitta varia TaxID=561572 RepID=A0A833W4G1_9HYME|nr:hypothetical protein E2986_12589 [Frieseomelitta varia]